MLRSLTFLALLLFSQSGASASELVFLPGQNQLVLQATNGQVVGRWEAWMVCLNNKTIPSGHHPFERLRAHDNDQPNSVYGSYGVLLFKVSNLDHVGLHSGRKTYKLKPFSGYPNLGAIQTTDKTMHAILTHHARDRITKIDVRK